jgi:hypothetical protein
VAKTVKRGSIGEKREAVNMIEQSKFWNEGKNFHIVLNWGKK